jgi:hypothetical protein
VSVTVLLVLAILTHQQLGYWGDNAELWTRVVALESQALQANPDNWVAENNLGHALLHAGQEEGGHCAFSHCGHYQSCRC